MEHHGQGGPELSPAQQTQRHSNQNPAPDLSRSVDRGLWTRSKVSFRHPGVFMRKKLERVIGLQIGEGSHLSRSFGCVRGC